ncbi:transmembrane protein 64-like [Argiope bruennichi]|uniref:transmembrane protein 64-like n=1 Tax=Argiope bruennichi TaxID=94029 RepID=UPI0024955F0B|nr:transmembrane protein 64-like [Argiope bruennichi]
MDIPAPIVEPLLATVPASTVTTLQNSFEIEDSLQKNGSHRTSSNAIIRTRRRAKCLASKFMSPKFVFSCIPACAVLIVLTYILIIGRDYVKYGLLWLDNQEEWVVCFVFLILYTAVSFPLTWGYVLLNLACGYHYGLIAGTIVTAFAASAGIVFAHLLMKHYFIGTITAKLLGPDVLKATVNALQSAHAFKLIAISRLTPIPFGLQNALFAISPVCLWRYVGASALGLFPTQLISVYLGTTVRSMEEVLVDENTATVGYGVLILQVIVSVALLAYILKRARQELRKSVKGDLEEIIVGNKNPLLETASDFNFNYISKKLPYTCSGNRSSRLCLLHRI